MNFTQNPTPVRTVSPNVSGGLLLVALMFGL